MIYIREISKNDLRLLNEWRNNLELISYLGSPYRYINIETDEQWFENYMKHRDTQVRCAIVLKKNNKLVGFVNLTGIDNVNRNCEFHILIGDKKQRGKGIGYKATLLILMHAFNNLNMHRVWLTVLESNKKAVNLYKKIGFVEEGTMRQCIYKNGKYHDMKYMGILDKEFNKKYAKEKNIHRAN